MCWRSRDQGARCLTCGLRGGRGLSRSLLEKQRPRGTVFDVWTARRAGPDSESAGEAETKGHGVRRVDGEEGGA